MAGLPTILLVEDNSYIQDLYATVLTEAGYTVVTVESGDEALTKLQNWRSDLILLDIMIPGKSGLEVLKILRTEEPFKDRDYKVIMLTNLSIEVGSKEAIKYRADGYILKIEITPSDLVRIVQDFFKTVQAR